MINFMAESKKLLTLPVFYFSKIFFKVPIKRYEFCMYSETESLESVNTSLTINCKLKFTNKIM